MEGIKDMHRRMITHPGASLLRLIEPGQGCRLQPLIGGYTVKGTNGGQLLFERLDDGVVYGGMDDAILLV